MPIERKESLIGEIHGSSTELVKSVRPVLVAIRKHSETLAMDAHTTQYETEIDCRIRMTEAKATAVEAKVDMESPFDYMS